MPVWSRTARTSPLALSVRYLHRDGERQALVKGGRALLRSADPRAEPVVDPACLSDETDLACWWRGPPAWIVKWCALTVNDIPP